MKYKKIGGAYQVEEDFWYSTGIVSHKICGTGRLRLLENGDLFIRRGYVWDGATGAIDNFMDECLVHDSLYELMRKEKLPQSYRKKVDKLLYKMCREGGMNFFRARYIYLGVRLFAQKAAKPESKKKIYST